MRCIIFHSETIIPEILAMRIKCRKGFIAYHKYNGITTMKKHVESNHFILLQKLLEDPTNLAPRFSFDRELNKKRTHVSPFAIKKKILRISSRKMM
jgi:hypothetical protein